MHQDKECEVKKWQNSLFERMLNSTFFLMGGLGYVISKVPPALSTMIPGLASGKSEF